MAHGDLSADELFRLHYDFVARFALRIGVASADVDDVVQEVFMLVHRQGGYIAGAASPKSWLTRTLLGVASTYRRSRRRRPETLASDPGGAIEAAGDDPEARMQNAQGLARVQVSLDTMDPDHRVVFVLYELEGESCEDIARTLELPVGTIYSRLHHARKRFLAAHSRLRGTESAPSRPHASSSAGMVRRVVPNG